MSMASLIKPTLLVHRSSHNHSNPTSTSLFLSPVILSFPFYRTTSFLHLRVSAALRSDGDKIGSQESQGFNLLRKPVVSPASRDLDGNSEKDEGESEDDEGWIDWEDKILEDTVPLVGFVRMILHSGRYESGVRLSPEHERTILERLLPYHPEFEKKIGCGIDYITETYLLSLGMQRSCLDLIPQSIQHGITTCEPSAAAAIVFSLDIILILKAQDVCS